MQSKTQTPKKLNIILDLVFLVFIAWWGFYVNRGIEIKGLYMDDLYMWSCYGEQNLLEFAFPIGTSTRFRPVYWLATYLQMMIVGTHITRFVSFNIVINILAAYELYFIAKKLSKTSLAALLVSVSYLASRFAYYQIGQALGLMETMALMLAIGILYLLYAYMTASMERHGTANANPFNAALILYFLLAFTHERYICLLPLFYLPLLARLLFSKKGYRGERWKTDIGRWVSPIILLLIIVAIRTFAIGKALPAGTGGTEVTDTFNIQECIGYAISQVLYIFGVNAGPEHLNGLPWEQTPWMIKRITKFSILFIGLVVIAYAIRTLFVIVQEAKEHKTESLWKDIFVGMLFVGFIGLCIAASSVTIRVEMRWIYVSFGASLLYASYMIGRFRDIRLRYAVLVSFAVYILLSVYTNMFYRGYFDKLYFWPNQLRMNSLAEQTVEKYGTEGVFGKDIYILENTYEMSEFYGNTFFKTFDPKKTAEGTNVIFAASREDVSASDVNAGKALVLIEVPEENAYLDITDEFID